MWIVAFMAEIPTSTYIQLLRLQGDATGWSASHEGSNNMSHIESDITNWDYLEDYLDPLDLFDRAQDGLVYFGSRVCQEDGKRFRERFPFYFGIIDNLLI